MSCNKICDLPDSLLTQILLNLPTKDSVKTNVLSTRWGNLWLSVPGLHLATHHFPCKEVFARFMDRFNNGSRLQNFTIWYYQFNRVMEFVDPVFDRGIQHLDVSMDLFHRDSFMRQNIYNSKTLVSLKLGNIELKNPEFAVSLPCLKIMHLRTICYGNDGPLIVEKLISGCPVLEDLELIRPFDILNEKDVVLFLRVSSHTLKRCCLRFASNRGDTDFKVEINAPRLKYLSLSETQSDRIMVKNLSSLFMLDIHTNLNSKCDTLSPLQPEDLSKRDIFCDFLTEISSVRHMITCEWTLEVLNCYYKLVPIPHLHNLYYLQVKYISTSLQLFPAFLESCPNLKILSLVDFCDLKEQIDFTSVPRCLISTLEYVEIKLWKRMMKDETGIIKLVNSFLENSTVLKKLTLSFRHPSITNQDAESYKKHPQSVLPHVKLSLIDIT